MTERKTQRIRQATFTFTLPNTDSDLRINSIIVVKSPFKWYDVIRVIYKDNQLITSKENAYIYTDEDAKELLGCTVKEALVKYSNEAFQKLLDDVHLDLEEINTEVVPAEELIKPTPVKKAVKRPAKKAAKKSTRKNK